MLIGGWPGFASAKSSASRMNGERVSTVRTGIARSVTFMDLDYAAGTSRLFTIGGGRLRGD
jgi:hypothetical protein